MNKKSKVHTEVSTLARGYNVKHKFKCHSHLTLSLDYLRDIQEFKKMIIVGVRIVLWGWTLVRICKIV